jgi:hypothetical protein
MSGTEFVVQPSCRSARFRGTLVGAGIVAAIAVIAMTIWPGLSTTPARATNVMVLYVGAEDCAPCRAWKNGDGAAFFASADFARLTYREVKSPHLHDVLEDENWPDEIRSYRNRLQRSDGVPLWLVVSDDEVVEQRFGAAEWRASILPKIKLLLR